MWKKNCVSNIKQNFWPEFGNRHFCCHLLVRSNVGLIQMLSGLYPVFLIIYMHFFRSKHFETDNDGKMKRLNRLKFAARQASSLLKCERYTMTVKDWTNIKHYFQFHWRIETILFWFFSDSLKSLFNLDTEVFEDLPTKDAIITDDERIIIQKIRKCKNIKEDVEQVLQSHEDCRKDFCKVHLVWKKYFVTVWRSIRWKFRFLSNWLYTLVKMFICNVRISLKIHWYIQKHYIQQYNLAIKYRCLWKNIQCFFCLFQHVFCVHFHSTWFKTGNRCIIYQRWKLKQFACRLSTNELRSQRLQTVLHFAQVLFIIFLLLHLLWFACSAAARLISASAWFGWCCWWWFQSTKFPFCYLE